MEKGERTAFLAVFVNLTVFGIKLISAIATDSIALRAETFHTLADLVASLTIFIGLKLARRKSKSFPYGLYKIENLMSVVVSLFIIYTGYEIILEVFSKTKFEIKNSWLAFFFLLFAVGITFFFSGYEKKIAGEIHSPILFADAAHIRVDVLSNVVVLTAVIANIAGFDLDRIAAFIVVIIIFKTGIQILVDGLRVLLDASVGYETLSKAEKIILGTPQVVEIKTLIGRNSGRFKFIEADIVIKTHDFDKAYLIVEQIEKRAIDEIPGINRVLIQYEPLQKEEIVYAIPMEENQTSVSLHFGEAHSFMMAVYKAGEKTADRITLMENPFCRMERGKGIFTAEWLAQHNVDVVLIRKEFSSKGPLYVFSNSKTEVVLIKEETPELALKNLGLKMNVISENRPAPT